MFYKFFKFLAGISLTISFWLLPDAAQAAIKIVIENDLEDRLNKINQKIEEISL